MVKVLYILAALLIGFAVVDFGKSEPVANGWALIPKDVASDQDMAAAPMPPDITPPVISSLPSPRTAKPKIDKPAKAQPSKAQAPGAAPPKTAQFQTPPVISAAPAPKMAAANVCPAPRAGSTALSHFGQPIRLNGANLAWSRNVHYAKDVGTDFVDMRAFRQHFANIAKAGGNSARWWMHTNGSVTPNIDPSGRVLGLSAQLSDQAVVAQVRRILDAAWEQGILLNITLFSFDMMCDNGRQGANNAMLNTHYQSYIDKALTPLVSGLKDHPALFAWEIFNEAEGMAIGTSFFGDPNLQNCATGREQPTWVMQRFINHAAARIHALDPNVKVTSSVGHPSHFEDYTNSALLGQGFSVPGGDLDFYQIHWYAEDRDPFIKTSASYGAGRPIVVGEYSFGPGRSIPQNSKTLFKNGYAGAWVWSQTSMGPSDVYETINSGAVCAPPLNKSAVLSCIQNKSGTCYKRR